MSKFKPVILYVDDEADNLEIVKSDLEKVFKVVGCTSAKEALAMILEVKPCIILSDLDMPGMNGISLLERVKAEYPHIRRAMITGKSTEVSAIEAINSAKISCYIRKPFKGNELEEALTKLFLSIVDEEAVNQKKDDAIKKARNENVELMKTLVKSQKMALLGTFSAGIFHEITNPLGAVLGAQAFIAKELEKLEKSKSVEKMMKCASIICSSTDLAFKILTNLKNYSSESTPEMLEALKISQVIDTVQTLAKDRAADRCVEIQIDLKEDFSIHGNLAGLYQMLMNLVSNAIDASKPKSDIFIRAFSDKNNWTLEVEDTGMGIPEENLQKLMDAFFTTKSEGHGTGLGLFVVQQEIDRHRAKLDIKSEVGKGTKFSIVFPLGISKGY